MLSLNKISGQIVDVINNRIFPGELSISEGRIIKITEKSVTSDILIAPGFVDAHIHIESSMLTPQHFADKAIQHGTVGLVCDPHEIANVLGIRGIEYMIGNSEKSPVKFTFGAPSCVPATVFENNGAQIGTDDIKNLFDNKLVNFLGEMMNYPGVIHEDPAVIDKINLAKKYKVKIDGHAPGLKGKDLYKYISMGISTDHECVNSMEAVEKIKKGMKILIREGSAAKNFNELFSLIDVYPDKVMLCSDDLHPDDLMKGHINLLVKRAIKNNINIFKAWKAASFNAVKHYNLNIGLLRVNDPADFIVIRDNDPENILLTVINGRIVYDKEKHNPGKFKSTVLNNFKAKKIKTNDLSVKDKNLPVKIIIACDDEIITKESIGIPAREDKFLYSDINKDILKICVINRYKAEKPFVGFIKGFKLKRGAIASSIAHDSHNIIALGVHDKHIMDIVNWIIDNKGGIAVHNGSVISGIPLPIAGIISDRNAEDVSRDYVMLNIAVKKLGCTLNAPFMTLSFMSLLVIPELKISNKGLFNVNSFSFTDLYSRQS